VLWVPFVLYGAVLVGGLAGIAGHAVAPWRAAGFAAGLLALIALEVGERHRWPVRTPVRPAVALLAARIALVGAVAGFDLSGLSPVLFVLIPFTAYFTFGRRVSVGLGVAGVAALAGHYALSVPGWYTDDEYVSDLLMYGIGLTLAISMAAVAVGELEARTRLEQAMTEVAALSAAEERNRLARDIHDSLGHHLTAVTVQLEKAVAFRERDAAAAEQAVVDARWSARRALEEVRQSVRALREAPFSLAVALAELARYAGDDRMRVTVAIDGDEHGHDVAARVALYRAAQEALTNSRKHGHATAVSITASFGDGPAELVVADDGVGRTTGDGDGNGFGLRGMREGVQLLSGTVDAAAGAPGFTVTVTIPRTTR
jgi:signal transduction histidine kinase